MAVEVFTDDPSPFFSGSTRDVALNAPSSFHTRSNEAFPAQITTPAPTSRKPSATKTRGSRSKVAKHPSRSIYTLPPRASTMSDSEQDKKRNKLGYQRISIACGKNFTFPSRLRLAFIRTVSRPTTELLLISSSTLPSSKNPMPARRQRPARQMPELHPPQEGMRLLSYRSTKRLRVSLRPQQPSWSRIGLVVWCVLDFTRPASSAWPWSRTVAVPTTASEHHPKLSGIAI